MIVASSEERDIGHALFQQEKTILSRNRRLRFRTGLFNLAAPEHQGIWQK